MEDSNVSIRDVLLSYERAYINSAVEYYGSKKAVARELGITRNGLYFILEKQCVDMQMNVEYDPGVKLNEARKCFEDSVLDIIVDNLKEREMIS